MSLSSPRYNRFPAWTPTVVRPPLFLFSGLRPAPAINFVRKLLHNAMTDSSDNKEMQMQLALEACRQVASPNFSAITQDFPSTDRHTLRWRFEGIQTSRREAHSIHHQNLSIEEEEQLIITINKLTARGLPPTSQMVRNLAEEMISRAVGKNWTGQFVKRHQNRLESIYLRNIDNIRTQSEYTPMIKLFFDLVWLLYIMLLYFY